MRFRNSALLLLAATLVLPAAAQQQAHFRSAPAASASQNQPDTRVPEATFSVEANLVNVNVLVTDEDGRVLPGLRKENFRVLDNGVPQRISHFSPSTTPITIVLLLEYSAAGYNYYASKAATWSTRFLDELEPKDWVALVTYDMNSAVRADFTHNRASVRDALATLGFPTFREANLFDAVIETLDKLDPVNGRKSILLLSTGVNTLGTATFDEVMKRLRGSDVTIFGIGLAEEEYTRSLGSDIGYLQARSSLNTFSELTGGIAYFPRFSSELPDVFHSIVGFLRNEYTLSFSPDRTSWDGKYHKLTVEVIRPDGRRLTVKNQKGRERKVSVMARPGYVAPAPLAEAAQRAP